MITKEELFAEKQKVTLEVLNSGIDLVSNKNNFHDLSDCLVKIMTELRGQVIALDNAEEFLRLQMLVFDDE